MDYLTATVEMADAIHNILHTTIRTVYPKYYPKEVVDFFCQHHSREHILEGYKKSDGTVIKDFPATLEELEGCEPVYEEHKGFEDDISKCRSFDELPEICKSYIKRLEELCECKIAMIGVGPDREQQIER